MSCHLKVWSNSEYEHRGFFKLQVDMSLSWYLNGCEKKKKDVKATDLFEEPDDVLADLSQANNDIIHVDVVKCGMISAFSSSLVQNQIPAVYWREEVLFFPGRAQKNIIMLNTELSRLAWFWISSLPTEMVGLFSI